MGRDKKYKSMAKSTIQVGWWNFFLSLSLISMERHGIQKYIQNCSFINIGMKGP